MSCRNMLNEWVIIDTETDGLYYPVHVVEVAAQRMRGFEPVGDSFQAFIDHGVEIPPQALAVHGYTKAFLAQNGRSPQSVYNALRDYVSNRPIASHNLSFDWDRALAPELYRLRMAPIGFRGFCTWMLSRRVIYESVSHKLDHLRDHFSLTSERNHSARGDVQSVVDLISRVISSRLLPIGIDTVDKIANFSKLTPIDFCRCMVLGVSHDEYLSLELSAKQQKAKLSGENRQNYENLCDQLKRHQGHHEVATSLLYNAGILTENPDVVIENHTFLFTGKMAWGSRSHAGALLTKCRGILSASKYISKKIDYLVLGEDPEKGWHKVLGGKFSHALQIKMLEDGSELSIILESDFVGAINKLHEVQLSARPFREES